MRLHHLAIALALACYALLLLGGYVHNTGASLACGTDWPRCNGTWVPEMKGGVLYEHSHRILAFVLGVGTTALTVAMAVLDRRRHLRDSSWIALASVGLVITLLGTMALRASSGARAGEAVPGDKPMLLGGLVIVGALTFAGAVVQAFRRRASLLGWALLAFGLVAGQGILGALTVVVGISPVTSTAHLGTSMLVFGALLVLALRTRDGRPPVAVTVPAGARRLVLLTIAMVYIQMVLGAVVRHLHAGMYCGAGFPLCFGQLWPADAHYAIYLHILHRFFGLLLLGHGFGVWMALRKGTGAPSLRRAAVAVPLLLLVQVALGIASVMTGLDAYLVTAHLGVAAAILADLVWLVVAMRPDEVSVASRVGSADTVPAAAAGGGA